MPTLQTALPPPVQLNVQPQFQSMLIIYAIRNNNKLDIKRNIIDRKFEIKIQKRRSLDEQYNTKWRNKHGRETTA